MPRRRPSQVRATARLRPPLWERPSQRVRNVHLSGATRAAIRVYERTHHLHNNEAAALLAEWRRISIQPRLGRWDWPIGCTCDAYSPITIREDIDVLIHGVSRSVARELRGLVLSMDDRIVGPVHRGTPWWRDEELWYAE